MKQLDLICNSCPLVECREESLWCMYRLLSRPNKAQKEVITLSPTGNLILLKPYKRSTQARQRYDKKYYRRNRAKKIKAAKDRQQRIREEKLCAN